MELVKSEDMFKVIDAEFPGATQQELEARAGYKGRKSSAIAHLRKREWLFFTTADKVLTNLDLSHCFATGEVPVYEFERPPWDTRTAPVRKQSDSFRRLYKREAARRAVMRKLMQRKDQTILALVRERDELRQELGMVRCQPDTGEAV